MKLAALFSGGKDSTYAIYKMLKRGHEVECILSIVPKSEDSMLFHYPNIELTSYLAEAMEIPYERMESNDPSSASETIVLQSVLEMIRPKYMIDGIVHGGISSQYQRSVFEKVCKHFQISMLSPLWGYNPKQYMHELIDSKFAIMITGVASLGLSSKWLGSTLDKNSLAELEWLSSKYGFNLNFEGGEAETIVTDCPVFKKKLVINEGSVRWYGDRGIFEIRDVNLTSK
jgi:diphthine-ammonia ligase